MKRLFMIEFHTCGTFIGTLGFVDSTSNDWETSDENEQVARYGKLLRMVPVVDAIIMT